MSEWLTNGWVMLARIAIGANTMVAGMLLFGRGHDYGLPIAVVGLLALPPALELVVSAIEGDGR